MASLKCTSCGHRVFLPTTKTECPNCGNTLFDATKFTTPLVVAQSSASPSHSSFTAGTKTVPPLQDTIVVNGIPTLQKRSRQQSSRLFENLFSRRPNLQGIIISLSTHTEMSVQRDWIALFFAMIGNILWAMFVPTPTYERGRDDEQRRKSVTLVRLQTPDGELHDARVEGDLQGGNLMQGDTLSLWGRTRKGTLIVTKGYNDTSHSKIFTSKRNNLFLSTIMPFLVLVLALFLLYSTHPLSLLSSLLGR